MPNPGNFHGKRFAFLTEQKPRYIEAYSNGHGNDCIADIQRRYFKRFPIELDESVEPSDDACVAVDDDAADPKPPAPDEDTMTPEEFAAAVKAFQERQSKVKEMRLRITRWFVYRRPKPSDVDTPMASLTAPLLSAPVKKKRQPIAFNLWAKAHSKEVEKAYKRRCLIEQPPKEKALSIRSAVAREEFFKLPQEVQDEWQSKAKEEHQAFLAEQEKEPEYAIDHPISRQPAIEGLVGFAQPILDQICLVTGMKALLIVGGPEPAAGGRLSVIGVVASRSGLVFSPWEQAATICANPPWEHAATVCANPDFDFQGLVGAAGVRQSALREGQSGDEAGGEDDSPLSSPPSSPRASLQDDLRPKVPSGPSPPLPSSPASTPCPSTSASQASATAGDLPEERTQQGNKQRGHANRKRKRQAIREECGPNCYEVRAESGRKHVSNAQGMDVPFNAEEIPIARTGYVGIRAPGDSAVYPLRDLVGPTSRFKFDLLKWNGRTPLALLDRAGRIVAALVGRPSDDPSWEMIQEDAVSHLEWARGQCKFSPEQKHHRRGRFPALAAGISHGGGQVKPGNLVHQNAANDSVLKGLTSHPAFICMAGFASRAFATWAPRLHRYYSDHLDSLLRHETTTSRPFDNSVWAAATFNFGPATTCRTHTDAANLPFGWCGITALGDFDPKKGGHLVLWELRRVIEFPPGSTVLIPSAAIRHSNVPIQRGEHRYSFTQYTAGGIFRWVDHGFQTKRQHQASLSHEERAAHALEQSQQLSAGLQLFSTVPELEKTYAATATVEMASEQC